MILKEQFTAIAYLTYLDDTQSSALMRRYAGTYPHYPSEEELKECVAKLHYFRDVGQMNFETVDYFIVEKRHQVYEEGEN